MFKRFFIGCAAALLIACGGGGESDPSPGGVWDVSGFTKSPFSKFTAVLVLAEDGNTTFGTLETSIGSCVPKINFKGSAYQGELIASYKDDNLSAGIDAKFSHSQMAGNYFISSKACAGFVEGGFTAIKR